MNHWSGEGVGILTLLNEEEKIKIVLFDRNQIATQQIWL